MKPKIRLYQLIGAITALLLYVVVSSIALYYHVKYNGTETHFLVLLTSNTMNAIMGAVLVLMVMNVWLRG